MKKISLFLAMILLFTSILVGCGGNDNSTEVTKSETKETETEIKETKIEEETDTKEETEEETETEEEINVDEKILNVDVTLPTVLILDEDETVEDLKESAKSIEGFLNVKDNEDGTVTYTMTKAKHKEMMDDFEDNLNKVIEDLIENPEGSITNVEYNNDQSEFKVFVDPEKYNDIELFNGIIFYMQAALYRSFVGAEDFYTTVIFINEDTDEIIEEMNSEAFYNKNTETSTQGE